MDFSETIVVYDLKLEMTEVKRTSCRRQNLIPWGLYASCQGAIYMY